MSIDLEAVKHTPTENFFGILTGCYLAALGIYFMKAGGVVTGGTAGIALLLTYVTSYNFGLLYFAISIPFIAIAIWKKGWKFSLKTLASIAVVGWFETLNRHFIGELHLNPYYASIGGNILCAIGLLALFRHSSSLGGVNIIALLAQERLGIRAGYAQLSMDALVMLLSLTSVSAMQVAISVIGVIVLNLSLATNHRPGRYQGF